MKRERCEMCRRPMATTADWERTYVAYSGRERALCWSGDSLCKPPERTLVREWWEVRRTDGSDALIRTIDDPALAQQRAKSIRTRRCRLVHVRRYRSKP